MLQWNLILLNRNCRNAIMAVRGCILNQRLEIVHHSQLQVGGGKLQDPVDKHVMELSPTIVLFELQENLHVNPTVM